MKNDQPIYTPIPKTLEELLRDELLLVDLIARYTRQLEHCRRLITLNSVDCCPTCKRPTA